VHLIEIAFPESKISARFISDDTEMKKIYDAAKESFKANTVDIFMDCPSRERAGWLCDSFFTARCESVLTGEFSVEKAFLRNFILPDKFEFIPSGMLPMCYPSDHNDGVFIPNWAMWYGIELCEYYERSGDLDLVLDAKNRIYALLDYFSRFENEYSLLENLESWIFIEWSKSNDLVRDVSFGTNMLYSYLLKRIGALYGDNSLKEKAEKIKNAVNELSMTESGFYCDNAVRKDGKLVLSGERTESVQYYAFFCDIATPDDHEWLWNTLVNDFGYDRQTTGKYPEIYPANAFIGNYLRLDLLDRYGYKDALYDNILGYFTYMADKTGTLWENTGDYASCNHGFASHVIYWMKSLGLIK
jgi:alpha-L-rhamnosidase